MSKILPEAATHIATWHVNAQLAECPQWLADRNALLWIDVVEPSVNILDLSTGTSRATMVPAKIGSATIGKGGVIILALETGLWALDRQGNIRRCASPDMTGTLFNDGKCDPAGRFWIGTRSKDGSPGKGCLYRLDCNGTLEKMASGFDVCNGLGWNATATAFYLIDTVPRLLYRFDFDLASGSISNPRVVQDFKAMAGKPDGLAIDCGGTIWCAMWDGGGIQLLAADGGSIGFVATACPRPTSCAFGGDDGRTLFVTSASIGLDRQATDYGRSGQIFAFRARVPGVPVAAHKQLAAVTW